MRFKDTGGTRLIRRDINLYATETSTKLYVSFGDGHYMRLNYQDAKLLKEDINRLDELCGVLGDSRLHLKENDPAGDLAHYVNQWEHNYPAAADILVSTAFAQKLRAAYGQVPTSFQGRGYNHRIVINHNQARDIVLRERE